MDQTPKDFIDLTVYDTPKPQAASTIERKSFRRQTTNDIPTRDTDNSNASSASSLGLLSLAHIEDIQDYFQTKNESIKRNSINEKLEIQRLLAQKAMERIDGKTKNFGGGLPAYLLQPSVQTPGRSQTISTPTKNESTINLSDLERTNPKLSSASENVNFEAKEISARSSSLSNANTKIIDTIDLSCPSPPRNDFSAKRKSIYEQIRQSDLSLAQLCDRNSKLGIHTEPLGQLSLPETINISSDSSCSWNAAGMQDSLYMKLQNELFTPGELAMEKLLQDERSWRRTNDDMPGLTVNKEHLNLSCFSGFIGDGDISVNSKHEKVSMCGFFKERCENVDDLEFKSSPQKKHRPLPLINNSVISVQDKENSDHPITITDQSILSISKIADAVSKMSINDTPQRVLEVLMKKVPLKPPRTSLYPPETKTSPEILRDKTNIPIVEITSSSEDWTDAKPNEITISSITESPSYSCSELEFSEDDTSNGRRQTDIKSPEDWIQIEPHNHVIKCCIYVTQNISLDISSRSNHWIFVKLGVKSVTSESFAEKIADLNITNEQSLLKSYQTEKLNFNVMCLVTGKITLLMQVEVTDMVTKQQKIVEHFIHLEGERIKISMTSEILDFGMCPEAAIKQKKLTICNESCVSIPLTFEILQDTEWVFLFASDEKQEHDTSNINIKRQLNLGVGSETKILIDMCAPKITTNDDVQSLKGLLQICLNDKTLRCLNRVQLRGNVGLTKVQFKTSCMPFVLLPGQTKSMQVRNSGVIDLDLAVVISDEENCVKECFTCDQKNIGLKPGQVGTLFIGFNPRESTFSSPIKSQIRLEVHRGPNFVLPVEGRCDTKTPELKNSPNLRSPNLRSPNILSPNLRSPNLRSPNLRSPNLRSPSPRNNRITSTNSRSCSSQSTESTGTLSYLQDGKLPIESTKTELVWGCLKPGKNVSQEFLLRNRCAQRVRLQAVIEGTSFKFVKDNTENGTHMSILLRASESRTVTVNFCPNTKGVARGYLFFYPYDQEVVSNTKRQMIQLYGYGGHCCVDVQKVAKDTSGRMWLSFGRLDYRETLRQSFILRNTGTLAAFACLSVSCKVIYPFMDSSVKISPTDLVIEPNKETEVTISFTPRPEDFKYIQKIGAIEVSEIASIKILTGPEPTRARIRRLFNKINSGSQSSVSNSLMSQLSSNFLVPRLSGTFENEKIPIDISKCKESSSALRDLLRDIDTRELCLTVERDIEDNTIENPAEDTCMFQSLVCANATVNDTNITLTANATSGRVSGGFCTVEPRKITLTPPLEPHGSILVRSHHSRPMPYEVCNTHEADEAGIQVSPQVGVLGAGDVALVTVTATRVLSRSPFNCMLMVYVENEVMEIEVKIFNAHARRNK